MEFEALCLHEKIVVADGDFVTELFRRAYNFVQGHSFEILFDAFGDYSHAFLCNFEADLELLSIAHFGTASEREGNIRCPYVVIRLIDEILDSPTNTLILGLYCAHQVIKTAPLGKSR